MGKVKASSNWLRRSCIGRGSYGAVSLAVNKLDGRIFAAKSVDLSSCFRAQLEALENEIRILRSISSPWVVEYVGDDVTVEDGGATSFRNLHLEYLPGGTAADLANRSPADVDEKTVRSYTWCVVSALRHVHSVGIVHCDVKGRNVLVVGAAPGVAKLSDLGSAREFADVAPPPRGSPLWMAPEVIRGEYQGPESDVWSLGCTVIEMITGRPAWEDHGADTLFQIGYSDELPEFPTRLSEPGRDFLNKCLRRDRTERWTCDQLLRHPFISSSAPPNSIARQSPRCVLDCLNSDFDDDDDVENDQLTAVSESAAYSGRDRIANLASNARAIWESDGWVTVRDVISDEEESASNACSSWDGDEGTGSEYPIFARTEREMECTSSDYSDATELDERTNSEYSNYGDGVTAERVDRGGGRWRGVKAGASCRHGLRERNWAVDFGPKGFPAGVIFLLNNLLDFTAVLCNSLWFIVIQMLFTFYSGFQSVPCDLKKSIGWTDCSCVAQTLAYGILQEYANLSAT